MELHHRLGQATPGLTAQLTAESFTSDTIELQTKLADRIGKLEEALDRVKRLQGIIPICGYCKKVRDEEDHWQNVDSYIAAYSEAEFSHVSVRPAIRKLCNRNSIHSQPRSLHLRKQSHIESRKIARGLQSVPY